MKVKQRLLRASRARGIEIEFISRFIFFVGLLYGRRGLAEGGDSKAGAIGAAAALALGA
jgi:hypothetical protein